MELRKILWEEVLEYRPIFINTRVSKWKTKDQAMTLVLKVKRKSKEKENENLKCDLSKSIFC